MRKVKKHPRPRPTDGRVVELRAHSRTSAASRPGFIHVLVADGASVFRAGLRTLLETDPYIVVAGEAASGEQAVVQARESEPDVVLMDLHLPTAGAVEPMHRICSDLPDVKVLVLATVASDEELCDCLQAGANGLLIKDIEPPDLLYAINVVFHGDRQLSPTLMSYVIDWRQFSEHHPYRDGGEPALPLPDAIEQRSRASARSSRPSRFA